MLSAIFSQRDLCHHFVGLHPLLHEVTEERRDVDEDHESAGDGQCQHRGLGRTGLDDGDGFVCTTPKRISIYTFGLEKFLILPFPNSVSPLRKKSLFSSPKSSTKISCEMFISSSSLVADAVSLLCLEIRWNAL